MYNNFFSFAESPFNVTPDPRFLFLTDSHREALASMMYGICERKGFVSIIGEVGTGKTTLIRHLLDSLRSRKVETVFLYQTIITFDQMLKEILLELDIPLGDQSKTSMIRQLNEYLIQKLARNENLALIIDEAQNLDRQALEDLRLLSNLETNSSKLLQILLVGQPELEVKLSSPELRQLKQRIAIGRKIRPLNVEESRQYIEHRLRLVGSNISKVLKPEALSLICEYAKGIPRNINMLCDNAFLIGFGLAQKKIDAGIIREAINDMGLSALEEPVPPKAVLRRRSRVRRNYRWPWAAYRRAALLVFLILILSLPFFFGKEIIKPTPGKLEARALNFSSTVDSPQSTVNGEEERLRLRRTMDGGRSAVDYSSVDGGLNALRNFSPGSAASQPLPVSPEAVVPGTQSVAPPFNKMEQGGISETGPTSLSVDRGLNAVDGSSVDRGLNAVRHVVTVKSGDTIVSLSQKYYQRADMILLDKILELNPRITNPHLILAQEKIKMPEITELSLVILSPDGTCKVHLATFSRPEYANSYWDEPTLKGKSIEIVPRKVSPGETWYRVLAGNFSNPDECLRVIGILKEKGLLVIPGEKS